MTRLFGRKNDKTTIAELEEYYANQDQNRSRTGRAWLLAILSVLITIIVVVALFYAGRWVYRAVTDDSTISPVTTTEGANNGDDIGLPTFDGDVVGQGNSANDDSSSTETENTTNVDGSVENEGVVSDEAVSTSESNADRVVNTGGEEPIPNTGAGDVLIAVPFMTAIAGYIMSRRYFSKQN